MDHAKHYWALIERARGRYLRNCFIERHHIIPRCMGGGDEPSNLVRLTAGEHCIAHLLLAKMFPDNEKLRYAAKTMSAKYPHTAAPANKRYCKSRRAPNFWRRNRIGNAIRARKRKVRRYKPAEVERMMKILTPKQFPA